ncbi:MAG: hypothetical protein LIO64_12120 [Akkermansia sp.]|nr:hypothetical protein [Akkermansia sp.]
MNHVVGTGLPGKMNGHAATAWNRTGRVSFPGVPLLLSVVTGNRLICSGEDMVLSQHVIDIHSYKVIFEYCSP